MTKPNKGGRAAMPYREGTEYKLRTVIFYDDQWEWLKGQAGGAAEWLRKAVDKAMSRSQKR